MVVRLASPATVQLGGVSDPVSGGGRRVLDTPFSSARRSRPAGFAQPKFLSAGERSEQIVKMATQRFHVTGCVWSDMPVIDSVNPVVSSIA